MYMIVDCLNVDHADDADFNNTEILFTIAAGQDYFDIQLSDIIEADGVNEAKQYLILVLEITPSLQLDLQLDQYSGVLVLTIEDDNREVSCDNTYIFMVVHQ